MTPIQQLFFGTGSAVASKTYVDDIFNTQVYAGNGTSSNTQTTGIDMTEDFLLWTKRRSSAEAHYLFDSERTSGSNYISAFTNSTATGNSRNWITPTSTGYQINDNDQAINASGSDYASWSFRKAPGFFTIKEYSGTGSPQSVSHDLGSQPGMILIKRTDTGGEDWVVYHRSMDVMAAEGGTSSSTERGYLKLNTTAAIAYTSRLGDRTSSPTATTFDVKNQSNVNASGGTYIAYIFGGGESNAATARSVGFSSSSTYLSIPDSNDFDFGSTFTFEAWVKPEFHSGGNNLIFEHGSFQISITDAGRFNFDLNHIHTNGDLYSSAGSVPEGQWTHVAVVGTSGTLKMYINGVKDQSHNRTGVNVTGDTGAANISDLGGYYFKGKISNLRIVKGTAVYTSSFRPPTEPLTNITNTVLLCCNNSSTTGSTVTPGTITANGSPTAETDSPFDDPAAHIFGQSGSESVIKTGSFKGDGTDTGPNVYLGFEPQWVMIKSASNADNWNIFDSMRGVVTGGGDQRLIANTTFGSTSEIESIEFNQTGFTLKGMNSNFANAWDYVFVAIRRPDGYCGKPRTATELFAMDTGAGSSTIPNFDSGFPVDFQLLRQPASTHDWYAGARLLGNKFLETNDSAAEAAANAAVWRFDSNEGWNSHSGYDSAEQSWMWKRSNSFTTLAYKGNGVAGRQIAHDMNNTVEMIWTKRRSPAAGWRVWHKGLNGGGSNAAIYYLSLNETDAETSNGDIYGSSSGILPTSTHWTVGSNAAVNENGSDFISMLFSSVTGISKVGSFTNSGGTTTVSCGFQPRFIIVKRASSSGNWYVYDTIRGINAGGEPTLNLNDSSASTTNTADDLDLTSTGFTIPTSSSNIGYSGSHIFYAHA